MVDLWEVALGPLERARRALWRLGCRISLGRAAVRDRAFRLSVVASFHILVALTLTAVAPLWLLLLGPLLLGVPHIVSDLRYLVVRPPLPLGRAPLLALAVGLGGMTALRLGAALGGPLLLEAEMALGGGAILATLALTPGRRGWRAVAFAVVAGLTVYGVANPWDTALWVGHLHNFVAFAWWLALARDGGPWRRVAFVAALYLAVVVAILAGALDGLFTLAWTGDAAGLRFEELALSLAPDAEPVMAVRLVTLFAFAQSIHYAVWLRLVPQRSSDRRPPPSLDRSVRDLRADLGAWGLRAVVVASVLVPLAALVDATETRYVYLLLALFHGWLELAVLSALLVARRPGAAAA
ncbi:MAG: hypothetical protein EP329_18950 [Deltaproteobacteria bacterium]|nr:MAG: hypothetical protein EP329_18950 [Deltaproteobacteria bacterium]